MLFRHRRDKNQELEEILNAVMEWPPLLETLTLRDTRYKKGRDRVGALGKPEARLGLGEVVAQVTQLLVATLSSREWRVEEVTPTTVVSRIAEKAVGDAVIADFSARGLAPTVLQALRKAGVNVDRIPEWIRDFQLSLSDIYRAVDVGGARIKAQSPRGHYYEITIEAVWVLGRLGTTIKFNKKK